MERVGAASKVITVRDAMLSTPAIHPAGLTVAQAEDAFRASAKRRLLLLVDDDGVLLGTVTRDDLADGPDPGLPALRASALGGRTVSPGMMLEQVHQEMCERGVRRLAVVDESGRLVGLLCLKRSLNGFCTDEGVAAMRRARRSGPEPR